MDLLTYLLGLEPEQVKEAIEALSPEKRKELALQVCHGVNQLSQTIVENQEHVWLTGELP